jgi:hypothetical protein
MNPWVHTQIRLAQRQGLLTGVELSPVQTHAVFLLDLAEQVEKSKAEDRSIRQSLLHLGVPFLQLFPEYGDGEAPAPDVDEGELDAVIDGDGPVRYVAPEEEITEERMNELLAQLMDDNASGSVSAADNEGWM